MRKLKDALLLKFEGQQSHQQIATALGISNGVVTKYAGLAIAARLKYPQAMIKDLDYRASRGIDHATVMSLKLGP